MELIPTKSGKIALWREGKGTPVIFLHGGPGDTHHYMRRMSQPLLNKFQCVNYDQRGVGNSFLERIDESTLGLSEYFEDLISIKNHLKLEKLTLVGHSWGAMLALYFNLAHPEHVEKVALVSMGPLDEAGEAICNERLLADLTNDEKNEWKRLRQLRQAALEKENRDEVLLVDRQLMELRVKSWIFDSKKRGPFLEEYFRDPAVDRKVNGITFHAARGYFRWDNLSRIKNPVWICYGEQDVAPVFQAHKIKERLAHTSVTILPECGHIPWLEQPHAFYGSLSNFLERKTN